CGRDRKCGGRAGICYAGDCTQCAAGRARYRRDRVERDRRPAGCRRYRICGSRGARSFQRTVEAVGSDARARRGFPQGHQGRLRSAFSAFCFLPASRCRLCEAAFTLHRLRDTRMSGSYFRTQITRTTAAFASDEVPFAVTSFALRNSRTVSDATSTDWLVGAAFVAVAAATTTGFSSARPANLPLSSSAGAPEKPSPGAGDIARSPPVPTWVTCA